MSTPTIKAGTSHGFIRVATVTPMLRVGDTDYNAQEIVRATEHASRVGARLIVFPELSVTGYTAGDLFHQQALHTAVARAVRHIAQKTARIDSLILIGVPVACEGKLLNTAFVMHKGKILGIVPKTYIPGYKEFYEERWFASARDVVSKELFFLGSPVPLGTDLLFQLGSGSRATIGVEICEDLWAPLPPSTAQALRGATIIANLSASNELVGKADYRKQMVTEHSARLMAGYVYVSSGVHESTTDVVFGGHALIAENGTLLKESKRFARESEMTLADIDVEHLLSERERTTSFGESIHESSRRDFRIVTVSLKISRTGSLQRFIDPHPFVPSNPLERGKRSEEIFAIQTAGLAKRMEYSGINKIVLGLSGGLDSTLAFLVAIRTFELLKLPRKNIVAVTLPGFATTKRTKSNAVKLAEALGVSFEEYDITKGSALHLQELKHAGKEDITYQNVQARYRTMVLMNKSNQLGALMLGTGDLSEIALGWTTFSGDHLSHYNVNAGIPKTLVRYLVEWVSEQEDFESARAVLEDICATPISPELVGGKKKGITQKTESLIGPYELHDFFLYHFLRWGSAPKKILFLAEHAFAKKYSSGEMKKWLTVFIQRFFANQWKRSVMPDGPKVGSVALSPRGDWRMPSDAEVKMWLKDLQ